MGMTTKRSFVFLLLILFFLASILPIVTAKKHGHDHDHDHDHKDHKDHKDKHHKLKHKEKNEKDEDTQVTTNVKESDSDDNDEKNGQDDSDGDEVKSEVVDDLGAVLVVKNSEKDIEKEKIAKGNDFIGAFIASVAMIIASEIGDKTFFIAAIMAMRHNRIEIFLSAVLALGLITALSAGMGFALPALLPHTYTHWLSTLLFLFFGVRLLKDAREMEADKANLDELQEVEAELKEIDHGNESDSVELKDLESGESASSPSLTSTHAPTATITLTPVNAQTTSSTMNQSQTVIAKDKKKDEEEKKPKSKPPSFIRSLLSKFFSPIFIQCFTMTFLAEWGDRSQITTIAMAAVKDPIGVTAGGIIGHACCTGVAVIGGKLLATRISERTVAIMGGVLFLIFGLHSLYYGP
jgi:putative Ca2+/H+ antiporter (TMEM165/GDT1 family)